jgi:hypothetical protein
MKSVEKRQNIGRTRGEVSGGRNFGGSYAFVVKYEIKWKKT